MCGFYLVDEILTVVVAQSLCSDDAMQVRLHQFLHEVYFLELFETGWLKDVENGDDVFVAKVPEEFDLAEGAETEHGVVERGDAFDSDFALGWLVDGRARRWSRWGDREPRNGTNQTMPYAPSPMTSSTRYALSTTKFSSLRSMDIVVVIVVVGVEMGQASALVGIRKSGSVFLYRFIIALVVVHDRDGVVEGDEPCELGHSTLPWPRGCPCVHLEPSTVYLRASHWWEHPS